MDSETSYARPPAGRKHLRSIMASAKNSTLHHQPTTRDGGDRVGMRRKSTLGLLAALFSLFSSVPAGAQSGPRPVASRAAGAVEVEGSVLAIQGEELVLDLGSSRGAVEGVSVEIWRPLKLKHPVTGKVLTDR